MNNVIEIGSTKPHITNKAKCLTCKHEWVAVAPVGTLWLDCPACTENNGRFIGQVVWEGPHWTCACGNDIFYIMPDKTYCLLCGKIQVFK